MGFLIHAADHSQCSVSTTNWIEILNLLSGHVVHVENIVAKRKYCLCKMKEYLEMLDLKATKSHLIFI